MSQEAAQYEIIVADVEATQNMCRKLMQTKHYQKIGQEGIFSIIQKARSLNIHPLDALNGGLYCVQGRVEMSSQTMNQLIRMAGHSIKKDEKSNHTVCILHGRRADNGDTWTESFSIEEAKQAGIFKQDGAWSKYPKDMLFARALSRLARQLFPDVIKGCYVQGEISGSDFSCSESPEEEGEVFINDDQLKEIEEIIGDDEKMRQDIVDWVKKMEGSTLKDIPAAWFDKLKENCIKYKMKKTDSLPVSTKSVEVESHIEEKDNKEVKDDVDAEYSQMELI